MKDIRFKSKAKYDLDITDPAEGSIHVRLTNPQYVDGRRLTDLLPSEIIRVAIEDLEKVEKSGKAYVDMECWYEHDPETDTCAACLAGSVLMQTCGLKIGSSMGFSLYWLDESSDPGIEALRGIFEAIDYLRCGDLDSFLDSLDMLENFYNNVNSAEAALINRYRRGLSLQNFMGHRLPVTYCVYEQDSERFKDWCHAVANVLEEVGL